MIDRVKFKIACASQNITPMEFARRNGVTGPFIYMILSGKRTNKKLELRMNEMISTEFEKLQFVTIKRKAA